MTGAKVLVIEDSAPTREVVSAVMRNAGHDVVVAPNGELGVRFAATHQPDLVLLDVYLPDIDGFTVLRRIHEHAPVPVVMLTGADDEQSRLRGEAAGAVRFLVKPVGVKELLATVSDVLRTAPGS